MQEIKNETTTITLDEDIASAIETELRRRPQAKREEIINELLRIGLKFQQQTESLLRFKVRPRSMGIRHDLNYDKIGNLLEDIEGPIHK